MKKQLLLSGVFFFAIITLFAQNPKGFNYQAIMRNAQGELVAGKNVGLRISILQGSLEGNSVYTETFSIKTNNFGLINISIGNGNGVSGNFDAIDWSTAMYFIKVELDATHTNSYIDMGTTQLLSVPYANFAFSGSKGESPYETWLKLGNTGSEEDFKAAQTGPQGSQGKSDYQVWLSKGNTGSLDAYLNSLTGPQGALGNQGQSDYEIWLKAGNSGTQQQYIDSITGPKGKQGVSDYQVWLSKGNKGTPNDYIKSLKGANGYSSWYDSTLSVQTNKKVGIGTQNPTSVLQIDAPSIESAAPLFEVKNSSGKTVFAIYENDVKIFLENGKGADFNVAKRDANNVLENLVNVNQEQATFYVDSSSVKGAKGGFAVSGRTSNKGEFEILTINTDSTQFYIDTNATKGAKGGFAVSGRTSNKAEYEIMNINADSTQFYINSDITKGAKGGFAVSGRTSNKGTADDIFKVTPDLTEVFVSEVPVKGAKGGFAVSGRTSNKAIGTFDIFHVQPKGTEIFIKEDPANKAFPKGFSIFNFISDTEKEELFIVSEVGTVLTTKLSVAPQLKTYAPDFITQNSAKSGGSVTDNDNVGIVAVGIIYNQTDNLDLDTDFTNPAIAGKINGNAASSVNFAGLQMTGLIPGTAYQVRAFATNAEGLTGYGPIETFTTYTDAPKSLTFTVKDNSDNLLNNALITVYNGTIIATTVLTNASGEAIALLQPGSFTFTIKKFGFIESTENLTVTFDAAQTYAAAPLVPSPLYNVQFHVYHPDTNSVVTGAKVYLYDAGANYLDSATTDISGNAYFNTIPVWDYLYGVAFDAYQKTGSIVLSSNLIEKVYLEYIGAVVEVTSATGKIWMDRNLGASQVANSQVDADAYGYLYQWGRGNDGHQLRNSNTTLTLSSLDNPGHADFIINSGGNFDWRTTQNDSLWRGLDGINNPCPSGFRLPTSAEWDAEKNSLSIQNSQGAFASALKLPLAGHRNGSDAQIGGLGTLGIYASSTLAGNNPQSFYFHQTTAFNISSFPSSDGYSVRCIKGGLYPTVATTEVSSFTETTATVVGEVYAEGDDAVTSRGLVYSTIGYPTIENNMGITSNGTGMGSFTGNLNSLTPATTYYVRAYATNRWGTTYGNDWHFYTASLVGGEVYNPKTGNIWMDRNLGATQVATSSTDAAAYGDLYQWGRDTDGHQIITSSISTNQSNTDMPGHGDFIADYTDWRATQNDNLWQGVTGINNPCPAGYRIPTNGELDNERATWATQDAAGAFSSPLKLTVAGYRITDGSFYQVGGTGYYWSSSVNYQSANFLNFSNIAGYAGADRGNGGSVRCIKDNGLTGSIPTIYTDSVTDLTETSATVGGTLASVGENSISTKGIVYSTIPNPTIAVNQGILNLGTDVSGAFYGNLTGLASITKYYVRAYATNSKGTAYGNELTFITKTAFAEVANPITGKIWMDRNLGAAQVATSSTDAASYGDIYQWGRRSDQHQIRTSGVTRFENAASNTETDLFIRSDEHPEDWTDTPTDTLWQGENGANNPCPSGFRIPTEAEFASEIASWGSADAAGGFNSNLKLPLSGNRIYDTGQLFDEGAGGYYWSSTLDGSNIKFMYLTNGVAALNITYRSSGLSVRCIKEGTLATVTTLSVTDLTDASATIESTVTNEGSDIVTVKGVVYSTSPNPTLADNVTPDGNSSGQFASYLTGLAQQTTYYVRSYATNSVGTIYGNELSFKTAMTFVEVTNPITGKIWMDRNLGASQVATSSSDAAAFGDLFQWGRAGDGHELRTSSTTWGILSANDNAGHSDFITVSGYPEDWRSPQNDNLWQGVNGVNNPCPSGFSVPTFQELADEMATWTSPDDAGAFDSPLKFTASALRDFGSATIVTGGNSGFYWSSTIDGPYAWSMYFYNPGYSATPASLSSNSRAYGGSIRCIKAATLPTVFTSAATFVTAVTANTGGNVTSDGTDPVTTRGIVYNFTGTPTVAINEGITNDGSGLGSFTSNLINLIPGSTYHLRAYAINTVDTAYGNEVIITTAALNAGEVYSPATGTIWMDKNLGATQVADSSTDVNAYGDLYQWGRLTDGHEIRTSSITGTLSSTDIPVNGDFIADGIAPYDWRSAQNDGLWQGVNGVNNPCPSGFRIPSFAEFSNENIIDGPSAMASPLKFPLAGIRNYSNGTIAVVGNTSKYWCNGTLSTLSDYWGFNAGGIYTGSAQRANGFSVRCIKEISIAKVTTAAAINIESTRASIEGDIINEGQSTVTDRGFVYSTLPNPSLVTNEGIITAGTGIGTFLSYITGLAPATTYYVKAYATNSGGTAYGNEVNFTTVSLNAGEVYNPATGKIWMDRNLGAAVVADSSDHVNAYGDLYQWGRANDGHQLRISITTTTLALADYAENDEFITPSAAPYDWRSPQNDNLWQGVNGINNPCPNGFRLPTDAELNDEVATWSSQDDVGAMASTLKMPLAGYRHSTNGNIYNLGTAGLYWSSTIFSTATNYLFIDNVSASTSPENRASGLSVRCIKELGIPSVTTTAASQIESTTATSGGVITNEGTSAIIARGVVYSSTANPTVVSNEGITSDGTATGIFTSYLTILTPGSTYYVRAYATNSSGTAYGNELNFVAGNLELDEVYNPATGKIWKDRNMGAIQVATSSTDADSYGDLYQWGRINDGHEVITSLTTSTLSSSDSPGHGDFITINSGDFDWRSPQNDSLWQGSNGSNNPCPQQYRIPTEAEFSSEIATWGSADDAGAFGSVLKLPLPGYRVFIDGIYADAGTQGNYWTSTINGTYSRGMNINSSLATTSSAYRSNGFSVRCIREPLPIISQADVKDFTGTSATTLGEVYFTGMAAVSARGVVYSTLPNPTIDSNEGITVDGDGLGFFNSNLTGLTPLTTYYIRTYAKNSFGTAYGPEIVFTTLINGEVQTGTGRIWMDKNLGAAQVATSSTDAAAYGDLYQWGRGADGHQVRTSSTTGTLSITDTPGNANYIIGSFDWRDTQNDNLWQGKYGVNNPCPAGFRIPTDTELTSEIANWSSQDAQGAFDSPLKLPIGGYRNGIGAFYDEGITACYWSSSPLGSNSKYLNFISNNAVIYDEYRIMGFSVRCIKEYMALVTTDAISNVGLSTATAGGEVMENGQSAVIAKGLVYGTTINPTLEVYDGITYDGSGLGIFTSNLTGLLPGTTYYIRAYATNNEATAYGVEDSFTTLADVPIITTSVITGITSTAAITGGDITSNGGSEVTASGVVYNTSGNPTLADSFTTDGNASGTYISNLTGLTLGVTYYVRAYATNGLGTSYGNEESFTAALGIGESYQGGIIAYILQSGDAGYDSGVPHGLIAAPSDQNSGIAIQWYNGSYLNVGTTGSTIGTGDANTNDIIATQSAGAYAARLCYDLSLNGYTDWYLPSIDELYQLYVNQNLIGGFGNVNYWSSTEFSSTNAMYIPFVVGLQLNESKSSTNNVRAVRSF